MPAAAVRRVADAATRAGDQLYGWLGPAGSVLLATVTLVLFQSIFWAAHVPWPLKAGIAAVAVISATSPPNGLLAVAGLSPLGYMVATRVTEAYPARITEAIVLAFFAGYAVWSVRTRFGRRATPSDPPAAPSLVAPVLLFSAVAVASCVVHYHFMQIWHDHPGPFLARLAGFLTVGYHDAVGNYDPFAVDAGFRFVAMTAFAVEGAALLLAAYLWTARDRTLAPRLVRMMVAGSVGAASLSFYAFGEAALREADPAGALPELFARRWTMFTPKLNSAASLLVLAGPMAIGAAAACTGWRRWAWVAAAALLTVALWINGTRVALLAAILVLAGTIAWFGRGRLQWRRLGYPALIGLVVLGAGLAATTYQRFYVDQEIARESLDFRFMFTETALRMFASAPAFGVGVDQYYLLSERFAPDGMIRDFRRVSAHNPFLQTAAELGVVGLVPFVWMIAGAMWAGVRAVRTRVRDPLLFGTVAGLIAFLITCAAAGHPLLIPMTNYPFWVVLGLAAGRAASGPAGEAAGETGGQTLATAVLRWSRPCVVLGVIALACTVPPRIAEARRGIDLGAVTYGLHALEDNGVDRFRWTTGHATMFIDGDVGSIELPLRAPLIDRTGPMSVEIFLDGQLANRTELTATDWRYVRIEIPPSDRRHRVVELTVTPTWFPAALLPGSTDPRELGVMLGVTPPQPDAVQTAAGGGTT